MRLVAILLCVGSALAQSAPSSRAAGAITKERVTEVISFLASDDLLGRDSPSPGLEAAARFLAHRLEKAGLVPGGTSGTFFHRYKLPGVKLDAQQLTVRVGSAERLLAPVDDVRPWRVNVAFKSELGDVQVVAESAFARERPMRARNPIFVVVAESSPMWRAAAGVRESLARAGGGEAPILLVREGVLASGETQAALDIAAPERVDVELCNLVAMLPGTTKKDEIVLVSSHYDHVGVGAAARGDGIYNGADDDATGTTAVLLLAEAFAAAKQRPARTLAFVCFSAEEKGLRGSKAFAADPPFPLERVVANLNIEMIGRPETGKQKKAWITGRTLSDFEAILTPALARAGVELVGFGQEAMLFRASDNFSLAQTGVVAHSISAGSLHTDYHQPSDEVGKLDLPHMTAIIEGLREAVHELASREAKPEWNDAGKQAIGGRR